MRFDYGTHIPTAIENTSGNSNMNINFGRNPKVLYAKELLTQKKSFICNHTRIFIMEKTLVGSIPRFSNMENTNGFCLSIKIGKVQPKVHLFFFI